MADSAPKVWFVTGASSGLGKGVVELALKKGNKVVATCRKPEALSALVSQYPSSQLAVLKLDVTLPSDITTAFAQAIATFGRIDVVYNNAGYAVVGEVEGTPEEVARAMFEVNFWGAMNVSREAVWVFRDINKPSGGRLLQASSIVGVQSMPCAGFYSTTKFALEGISEALSKELHPSWNIKITLLELGGFTTRFATQDSMVVVPAHPAYTTPDNAAAAVRAYLDGNPVMGDAEKAVREIYNISLDDTVGLRIPLGLDTVDALEKRVEEGQKVLVDTAKWSVDLK